VNTPEQTRIKALNATYLREEPPVKNFSWAGYEAWVKQQWPERTCGHKGCCNCNESAKPNMLGGLP